MPAAGRPPRFRVLTAVTAAILGVSLLLGAARADEYLHRGIESGDELPLVRQLAGRELGVNADLRGMASDDLESMAVSLRDQGIRHVRQPFAWDRIEPAPDAFDWSPYDPIVNVLGAHDIAVVAVITSAPDWASESTDAAAEATPPADLEDLRIFVDALMARFGDQVQYLQIWEQPNATPRWGGRSPDPEGYADMLATAATAARERSPSVHILAADLAPSGSAGGIDDVSFLQALYRAGAEPFFDAVAVSLPGAMSSPFDRWVDRGRMTMSRAVLIRETMIDAGDSETPIWATSYPLLSSSGGPLSETRIDFAVGGLERARSEWPWLGPIVLGEPRGTAEDPAEIPLIGPDGLDPVLQPLLPVARTFAATTAPGLVPSGAPALTYEGEWSDQTLGEATLKSTTEQGASVTMRFEGTAVAAILRQSPTAGDIRVTLDGGPLPGTDNDNGATTLSLFRIVASDVTMPLASGLANSEHELTIELSSPDAASSDQVDLTFGGVVVSRTRPSDWPVAVLASVGLVLLWYALREMTYALALWAGWLRRQRELDLGPPLGQWDARSRA